MPASSALATVRRCSSRSPLTSRPPMAPQPNPRSDTLAPVRPAARDCIGLVPASSLPAIVLLPLPLGEGWREGRPPACTILYPHTSTSNTGAPDPVVDAWAELGTTVGVGMRILIMGSGGIGGYYGARFALHGDDVVFVARGAHLEAMQTQGLELRERDGSVERFPVKAVRYPADAGGTFDFILFAVKTYDTAEAAQAIEPVVGPE